MRKKIFRIISIALLCFTINNICYAADDDLPRLFRCSEENTASIYQTVIIVKNKALKY